MLEVGGNSWEERSRRELWLLERADSWLPSAEAAKSIDGGDSMASDKPGG